ncbi:MAG TPA: YoaK family protein [Acidimicrobiales bacterium]|nr:YoaK family protein [Acidimicrobiales bacterium]
MTAFLADLRSTLHPARTDALGPLPPLLVALTIATGLVDAFSYLVLGHIFVANMTGNVLFLGLSLVGAPGFSAASSLIALLAFALGGLLGGRLARVLGARRGRHLAVSSVIQVALFTLAAVLVAVVGVPVRRGDHYALIVVLAICMGLQNATARSLAVPDLTTTVLTQTISGLAADGALGAGKGSRAGRRLVAVAAMLVGAIVGGELALHGQAFAPLTVAAVLAAGVAAFAWGTTVEGSKWANQMR